MFKKNFDTKKNIFKGSRALLLAALLTPLYLTGGCIQGQSEAMERDMNYVKTTSEKLDIQVRELEKIALGVQQDMDNTRKGLSSIETEIKSAIAESNAELERFREEFGFIRGTLEETDFSRGQFRDDINALKEGVAETNVQISALKSSADEAGKTNVLSEGELRELIAKIALRTESLERSYLSVDKNIIALEERINDISAPGSGKKRLAAVEPGDLYMKGFEEASNGEYVKAAETLKTFLQRFPEHDLADDAQYWLSESYYGKGDWERAILEFNKIIKYHPSSEKVAPSLLKQGLSFARLGANKEAQLILKRVVSKFEGTPEAEKAGAALKKLKGKEKKPEAKSPKKATPAPKKKTGAKGGGAAKKVPTREKTASESADLLPYPKLSPSTANTTSTGGAAK